jgi:2-iminobutanoate/2-iminopropanoate deaminase
MPTPSTPKAVATPAAPAAIGPYSQGVVAGNLLFVSGQLPVNPATGELVSGDIAAKTHQVIANVAAVAQAAGAGLDKVVKTTIFLKDLIDFPAVNQAYAEHFKPVLPARSTVQVAGLPKGADIEMEAVVVLG